MHISVYIYSFIQTSFKMDLYYEPGFNFFWHF